MILYSMWAFSFQVVSLWCFPINVIQIVILMNWNELKTKYIKIRMKFVPHISTLSLMNQAECEAEKNSISNRFWIPTFKDARKKGMLRLRWIQVIHSLFHGLSHILGVTWIESKVKSHMLVILACRWRLSLRSQLLSEKTCFLVI